MKSIVSFLLAGLAAIYLSDPAISQTSSAITPQPPAAASAMSQAPLVSPGQRATITKDLIAKWQSAAAKRPGGDGARWARILTKAVATASAANVLNATTARSVDEVHAALIGASVEAIQSQSSTGTIGNGVVAPQTLGSYSNDLVYTPLPNGRCRIADSRAISSPLVGTRSLLIEDMANYTAQGGNGTYSSGVSSTACGINSFTVAYALSITLISPAASGQFKVFQSGLPYQTGNSVSMNAGSPFASADLVVRNCLGCAAEIGIQSLTSVHYVIDVIGYYMPPVATPLSCYVTSGVTQTVSTNNYMDFTASACAAGYSTVETICSGNEVSLYLFGQGGGRCAAMNRSVNNASLTASRRCCQIPGR